MASWQGIFNWLGVVRDTSYDYDQPSYDDRFVPEEDSTPSYTEPAEVTDIAVVRDRRMRAATDAPARAELEPEVSIQIPSVLHAMDYSSMKEIGETFRSGQAVIMNLNWVGDARERRRLVDFSSGMVYALSGRAERLEKNVFLLVPAGVEVDEAGVAQAGLTQRSA
ncbi:MAG: cell division protein SepF [Propionibacteriaceae bacterium]|nr:cell division protein SepF [Propionibacteriaceae bacterium]